MFWLGYQGIISVLHAIEVEIQMLTESAHRNRIYFIVNDWPLRLDSVRRAIWPNYPPILGSEILECIEFWAKLVMKTVCLRLKTHVQCKIQGSSGTSVDLSRWSAVSVDYQTQWCGASTLVPMDVRDFSNSSAQKFQSVDLVGVGWSCFIAGSWGSFCKSVNLWCTTQFFDVSHGDSHTGNAPTTSVPLASCKATSPGVAAAKPHWLCLLQW